MVMLKKISLLFLFLTSSFLIAQETPVHFKFSTKKISDCEYDLQFTAAVDEPWHIYSLSPVNDGPNPTVFMFTKSADYDLVGKTTESKPIKEFDKVFEMNVQYFVKTATFTQRIKLKSDKKIIIKGKYEYQACTEEKCIFPPADVFEFSLQGTAACLNSAAASTANTAATSTLTSVESVAEVVAEPTADTATIVQPTKEDAVISQGIPKETQDVPKSWYAIFIAGFIGGALALLTPCVFPMIPMNVSFFTKQSKTKAEGIKNALLYAVSIIVLYVGLGLGVTVIFGAGALHSLSTNVWFNLAFFVLLLVFAMSFLGAFEITLPSGFVNKMDAKSDKGGYIGIFFMAFTLALVSFSCTGPIIGTLLVEAAGTMDLWIERERDGLCALMKRIHGLIVNDQEVKQLTGESNLIKAGKAALAMGPSLVIVKKGEHGCFVFSPYFHYALPAYPTEKVLDPTGAGDSFAGGFMGYLASCDTVSLWNMKRAVAYGTVSASLTVEAVGVDAIARADRAVIERRYQDLLQFVQL